MVKTLFKIRNSEFKNRIFSASGTFGYGDECQDFFNIELLGGIITKSISLLPRLGNKPRRIAETNSGMLNSIGLANIGIDNFIKEKLLILKNFDTKIIVNIVGNSIEDYEEVIRKFEDIDGITGYEVNISCPNVKQGGLQFGTNLKMTESIVKKTRALTDRALIIKLTPNVTKISDFACVAESEGADAVSLVNTFVGMAIDVESRRPKLSTITGGLSGPAIKPMAIAKVYETSKAIKIPVIGIGGISNYEDVIEFLLAGATAVEIGTATFTDPMVFSKIIIGLEKYCKQKNIYDIQDLVGAMVK
jgi:dihydroorotate dehydrogenase (NAD+) catalytic subunit